MDYASRARLKIFARMEAVSLDANPALAAIVAVSDYKAKAERTLLLHRQLSLRRKSFRAHQTHA